MEITNLIIRTQTEEQKKKEREETAGLIQSFSKNSGFTEVAQNYLKDYLKELTLSREKELMKVSSYVKYVQPTKEELELEALNVRFNESRQSFQETQERIAWQQKNHKQMLIDIQVEAMRIIEADKLAQQGNDNQQVNIDAGTGNHAGTEPKPREGGYNLRDEFAIRQVKDRPELLEMRAGMIKAELQKASNLFTSGYGDWWRKNPVFNKSEPGRNSK